MDSGSLRIREELMWRPDGCVTECVKSDSTEFYFMGSNWELTLSTQFNDVESRPKSSKARVDLINTDEEAFEPFQALTFIEDINNNESLCSSLTTVLPVKSVLLYMNLDHFKALKSKEVAVIVRFFSPAGESLEFENDDPYLSVRKSLVWAIRKPTALLCYRSPIFSLLNLCWKLEVHSEEVKEDSALSHNADGHSIYKLMLKSCDGGQTAAWNPFFVSSFLEDRKDFKKMLKSLSCVYSTYETLFKHNLEDIYANLPGLKHYDDVIVSCYFCPSTELRIKMKKENDSVQSTTDISVESTERLLEDLSNLLDGGIMTDMQVKSGECTICAHKAILAARSELLYAKLQTADVEYGNSVIELEDVQPHVLPIFVRYLYSGKIPNDLSEVIVCELFKVSVKYGVPTLRKVCSNSIMRNLNSENAKKMLDLAYEHGDNEMKVAAAGFIKEFS